jgi:hypothetical protein
MQVTNYAEASTSADPDVGLDSDGDFVELLPAVDTQAGLGCSAIADQQNDVEVYIFVIHLHAGIRIINTT